MLSDLRSQRNLIANLEAIFEGMAGTLKLKIPANQATKSFFISEDILAQHDIFDSSMSGSSSGGSSGG